MKDRVSVVLPIFNGARYIEETVSSVLSQTLTGLEVVVIDDGSTDGSGAIVQQVDDSRIRVIRQDNRGPAAARNLGIEIAHGDLVAFVDADDLWVKQKLEWQVTVLDNDSSVEMVFGHYVSFHSSNPHSDSSMSSPGFSSGTMLIRREALLRVGPFSTKWRVGEFIDWYAKAHDQDLREVMLPQTVLYRRLHEDNLGIRRHDARVDYARVVSAIIKRRRAFSNFPG